MNVLIAYVNIVFDHQCDLLQYLKNAMMQLFIKCCNLIGLPKFQPSSQKVVQNMHTLLRGRLLKAVRSGVWLAKLSHTIMPSFKTILLKSSPTEYRI